VANRKAKKTRNDSHFALLNSNDFTLSKHQEAIDPIEKPKTCMASSHIVELQQTYQSNREKKKSSLMTGKR